MLGEDRHREDAGVVTRHDAPQIAPGEMVRVADIDVAAPDPLPFAVRTQVEQIGRLRIVNEHEICVLEFCAQALGVFGNDVFVQPEARLWKAARCSLQTVVEEFGHTEEIFAALNDFPRGIDSQIVHERNQPTQDFGDATAGTGGIDMHDAGPGQIAGELLQLEDCFRAGHFGIG